MCNALDVLALNGTLPEIKGRKIQMYYLFTFYGAWGYIKVKNKTKWARNPIFFKICALKPCM